MTRLTLAALITITTVTLASAQAIPYFPTMWPQPGSFDGPPVVTQDDQGN
ncbi:hypothetical protein [Nioella sp.]